ncbi:MAG TPA: ABC transporter substrate-binding protein [Mycobacteriales bacterium]|nr:ABC transporter substrate-binding protein [Mycobacteriales bacterium]
MRTRLVAIAMLVALGGAACGARLPGAVQAQASREAFAVGPAAAGPGLSGATPAPGGNPTAVASQPGTVVSSGGASAPAVGPARSSRASASAAPSTSSGPTCSGGTDTGLTASTMTIGLVASLSGPVSGLFDGAVHGGETFANYVNHAGGGICGRQVKISVADDGTNCTQDENATTSLIGRSFALAGSFALYDGCGASVLKQHPDVADVHVALDPAADTPVNHFDVSSKVEGFATGMFHYYRQKYGAKLDRVGTIVENIPSAVAKQADQVHAAESQGWHFVDSISEQPTNSNFQNDFVKLCQREHITAFFELTETAANAATMVQNERQAGCSKSLLNIIPIAYDQAFISDYSGSKSDLNGIQGWNEYALFFNKDEAAGNPEVKLFQDWYERTYPGVPINLYGMFAWASDRLVQQAAEAVSGPLTRTSLMASLRKIKNYDDGGMIAPTDPVSGAPHCYILYQIQNGAFERVDDPKTGYRCDGKFLPRSAG